VDPGLARRMGESARTWTGRAFCVDRLVADTEALYRRLLESPASAHAFAVERRTS